MVCRGAGLQGAPGARVGGIVSLAATLLWAVVVALLALKVVATLVLLARPASARFADRSGRSLWWATKIAPLLAVPCLIVIAILSRDGSGLFGYSLLMIFVVIAVPLMAWRRFGRE